MSNMSSSFSSRNSYLITRFIKKKTKKLIFISIRPRMYHKRAQKGLCTWIFLNQCSCCITWQLQRKAKCPACTIYSQQQHQQSSLFQHVICSVCLFVCFPNYTNCDQAIHFWSLCRGTEAPSWWTVSGLAAGRGPPVDAAPWRVRGHCQRCLSAGDRAKTVGEERHNGEQSK